MGERVSLNSRVNLVPLKTQMFLITKESILSVKVCARLLSMRLLRVFKDEAERERHVARSARNVGARRDRKPCNVTLLEAKQQFHMWSYLHYCIIWMYPTADHMAVERTEEKKKALLNKATRNQLQAFPQIEARRVFRSPFET